jgi:ribosome-associated translation inhibitor RaiA
MGYVEIDFRGVAGSPELEAAVYRSVARLEASAGGELHQCHVAIVSTSARRVHVDVTLAVDDGDVVVAVVPHADVYVAISEAFREIQRKLRARAIARAPARRPPTDHRLPPLPPADDAR